jgi:hypothetical protein
MVEESGALVPVGGIIMWSGLLANIPSGWALCDGQSGRPDLRARFVVGASAAENPGGTGGSSSLSHSGAAVQDHPATATSQADVGATKMGTSTSTVTLLTHKHNTPVLAHTVTQPSPHSDSRPQFYKILFIMKV